MATIPRYRQEQRVGSQGPYAVSDVRQAGVRGEGLANIGEATMKAARVTAEYNTAKRRADLSTVKTSFDTEAGLLGQQAANEVISNVNVDGSPGQTAPDGSNMEELYRGKFAPLYAKANELPGEQRRVALMSIDRQQKIEGTKLFQAKVMAHANFTFDTASQNVKGASVIVSNNPAQYNIQMQKLLSNFTEIGMDPATYDKAKKLAEEQLPLAVVAGFTTQRDYRGAERATNYLFKEGKITSETQVKLLGNIDQDRRSFNNERQATGEHVRAEIERENKNRRDQALLTINPLIISNNPDDRAAGLLAAKGAFEEGAITIEMWNKMQAEVKDFTTTPRPSPQVSAYRERLREGREMDTFVRDVMQDDGLGTSGTSSLLFSYKVKMDASKSGDVGYNIAAEKADILLKTAFPGKNNRNFLLAQDMFLKTPGNDPIKAVMNAIKKTDPTNKLLDKSKPKMQLLQEERDALVKEASTVGISKERQKAITRRLRELQQLATPVQEPEVSK